MSGPSPEELAPKVGVRLSGTGGREALALHAFSYVREPASCIVLSQDVPLDWSSVAQLMSLYICLWPAIVTAIVGCSTLRCMWRTTRRLREVKEIEQAIATREVRSDRPL